MSAPDTPPADQEAAPPGSAAALRARYGARYRWLLLASVMVGTVAAIMSSTVINVAIPGLSHHFELGQARAQWVTSGFMVASTVAMLTTPWLLARFGYRATYSGSMLLLMAGGILGGFAQNYPLLLAARVAEGLAAGVVQPIPATIIMRAFQPHEQGRAGSLFGMGVVLAPAIGPSVGGLLVDWLGWRSIFFMVTPFCLACLWLARRFVPTAGPVEASASGKPALDVIGLTLGTAGTLSLLNGLVALHQDTHEALALLVLALLAALAFVVWQRKRKARGQTPLMDLALFAWQPFAMGTLVALIYGTALFGSTYLLPVYMLVALELPAASVGSILLPSGIALAVSIAVVGRLADRQPPALLVCTGLALLALSFALMVTIDLGASLWHLMAFGIVGRIGLGFILPSLNSGSMRGLPAPLVAHGASAISFVRMLGGATGVSLCGIVLEWRLTAHGSALTDAAHPAARLAAFDEVFLILAALCALAMLAARHLSQTSRQEWISQQQQ